MLHLGGAAFYRGDIVTAEIHSKAAIQAAELIGGITKLNDPYLEGRLLSLDDCISCLKLKSCEASCDYDPGPLSTLGTLVQPELQLIGDDEATATGLLLRDELCLPIALRSLVPELLESQRVKRHLFSSSASPSLISQASSLVYWLTLRILALRNRLLSLATQDIRVEMLRIVLTMWTLLPPGYNIGSQNRRINYVLAPKLRAIMEQVRTKEPHRGRGWEEIWLWSLMMGYLCSAESSQTQTWYAGEFFRTLQRQGKAFKMNIRSKKIYKGATTDGSLVAELTAFQKQFFFDESVLKEGTERLAEWLLSCTDSPLGWTETSGFGGRYVTRVDVQLSGSEVCP